MLMQFSLPTQFMLPYFMSMKFTLLHFVNKWYTYKSDSICLANCCTQQNITHNVALQSKTRQYVLNLSWETKMSQSRLTLSWKPKQCIINQNMAKQSKFIMIMEDGCRNDIYDVKIIHAYTIIHRCKCI